jgi:hypothetical protein
MAFKVASVYAFWKQRHMLEESKIGRTKAKKQEK